MKKYQHKGELDLVKSMLFNNASTSDSLHIEQLRKTIEVQC